MTDEVDFEICFGKIKFSKKNHSEVFDGTFSDYFSSGNW